MNRTLNIIKQQILNAFRPSLKSAVWLLKMMLPIMLLVSLLDYYGIIGYLSQYTTPLFNMIGLDGKAAFVFITSCLASIYSAIGVMALFGFEYREVVIMASMCLISHNLIIEGAIQSRTGVSFWGINLLRIASALVCGYLLNRVLPVDATGELYLEVVSTQATSLTEMFSMWITASLNLMVKVVIIIYALNILQNILKAFKVIDLLTKYLYPIIAILGLPRSTSFLWIVANSLGLAYGGAVIVEEISKGEISREDAALLNVSIAHTHSLIEDTILFIALGIGLWWLIIPRVIFSIVTVWAQRAVRSLNRLRETKIAKG